MTLQNLIDLAQDRDLSKSYPKADGVYIWDYKLDCNPDLGLDLMLIPSNSGKAGFKDKVSIQEVVNYVLDECVSSSIAISFSEMNITGVEEITLAKV
jgi:hypothetical protein